METTTQREGTSMIVTKTSLQKRMSENNAIEECRNLTRVLAKKIGALTRECQCELDNSVHIRSMGLTLATTTALVNTPNKDLPATHPSEILVDARGFTYKSVRFCDLERISDK